MFTRISLGVVALVRDRWITAVDFVVYQAHLEGLNVEKRRGEVSIKEIQELTGYNKLTIMRSRKRLTQVGLLQFEGTTRKILYVVAPMENWFTTVNQIETVDQIPAINQQRFTTVNQTPTPSPYRGSRESREKSIASSPTHERKPQGPATSTASPSPSNRRTENSAEANPNQRTRRSASPPVPRPPSPRVDPAEAVEMQGWLNKLRSAFPQMLCESAGPLNERTAGNVLQDARRRDPNATPESVMWWLRGLVVNDGRGNWENAGGIVAVVRDEYPIPSPTVTQDTSPLAQESRRTHPNGMGDTQITPEAYEWLSEPPMAFCAQDDPSMTPEVEDEAYDDEEDSSSNPEDAFLRLPEATQEEQIAAGVQAFRRAEPARYKKICNDPELLAEEGRIYAIFYDISENLQATA